MATAPDITKFRPTMIAIYGTTLADTLGFTLMIPLLKTAVRRA